MTSENYMKFKFMGTGTLKFQYNTATFIYVFSVVFTIQ